MTKPNNRFANLHTHTLFSDGVISPDGLVGRVLETHGLRYFALTDHDSLSGIEPVFRALQQRNGNSNSPQVRFIPGIELTLNHQKTGQGVHLIGLFPQINSENCREKLAAIEPVLGAYCCDRCRQRGIRDLDQRVHKAYALNLDGLADVYSSADEIIARLRTIANQRIMEYFESSKKARDVIRHPIPVTYQTLIDSWEDLMPDSTRERITLYVLRPDRGRQKRLAEIYLAAGETDSDACRLAAENQGTLSRIDSVPEKAKDTIEGLGLIQQAGGITILAHPAVNYKTIEYSEFDQNILFPMIDNGLDGIEVYYPYDQSYRHTAEAHYENVAIEKGLLISGGTDFHGDNRYGMDDVVLNESNAIRIINRIER